MLGDINYNLINIDKHAPTEEYYNIMTSNSFKPLITKPTRITDTNKTLIDHIWTNDLRNSTVMKSHIIITDITDHLPCLTVVTNPDIWIKGYRQITKRTINDTCKTNFRNKIADVKDALAFHIHNKHEKDINKKYNDYFDHITRIYNDCFPTRKIKVHSKTHSKPWMTPAVLKLIEHKNYRYSKKLKSKTQANRDKFRKAKKDMEELIKKEKDLYYKNLLENQSNNVRQRWNAIRLIINRKKVDQNNCIIPNNILGEHYSTVAERLATKLPHITKDDIPSTSKVKKSINKTRQTFTFREVNEREVYENILKLDNNKGPGIDNIDTKSIKLIADIISPHLTSLFNLSVEEGVYPQCFKIAKCVPIYKGSPLDPSLPVNYRPISILTSVNKTFERIMHTQISEYMEKNNLLPSFQYGYRKQHNTSQAILDFTDHITKACEQKLVTIAVFMDLSKAFDTVDKSILHDKLTELGLSSNSVGLITSYMSNRQFCMTNNSTHYNLKYGVPQGSILGPLLFIMYTFDMVNITKRNKVIVYADDTTILVSGRNLTEAKQHCNDILTRFYQYFTMNKLSINPSKTKYMIYKPNLRGYSNRKKLNDVTGTRLMMDSTELEQVKSLRFLGVIINNKLTWELHKQHIHNKICKTIGILYKCKHVMDELNMIKMYKAFIQPYFLYAIEVWGHSIQSQTDILVKLQSKVLRILYNYKRSDDAWRHNNERISSVKVLYKQVIQRICLKHHAGILPNYFSENIMPSFNLSQLQNRITRHTLSHMYNYKTPRNSTTNFITNCVNIWNSQSLDFKSTPYLSNIDNTYKVLYSLRLNTNPFND